MPSCVSGTSEACWPASAPSTAVSSSRRMRSSSSTERAGEAATGAASVGPPAMASAWLAVPLAGAVASAASPASVTGATGVRTSGTAPAASLRHSSVNSPDTSAARHAKRWIFPLDVLGTAPGGSSTTVCVWTSSSRASACRSPFATAASTVGSADSARSRPTSATTASASPAVVSTENAATLPARTRGSARSMTPSTSWGYRLRPRRMIRSLRRPVTSSCPSSRSTPRSPVRRYSGPSTTPEGRAWNVASLSSGLRQYPCATLAPDTQISPTCPGVRGTSESGSTTSTRCSASVVPQPMCARTPAASSAPVTASPRESAASSSGWARTPRPFTSPVTMSVPSARP
ncbi:hypothetical protein COSO111634_27185 [Corallococcus soli]